MVPHQRCGYFAAHFENASGSNSAASSSGGKRLPAGRVGLGLVAVDDGLVRRLGQQVLGHLGIQESGQPVLVLVLGAHAQARVVLALGLGQDFLRGHSPKHLLLAGVAGVDLHGLQKRAHVVGCEPVERLVTSQLQEQVERVSRVVQVALAALGQAHVAQVGLNALGQARGVGFGQQVRREHPNVFNPGAVALDDGLEPACVVVAVHLPALPDGAIRQALALKGQLPDGGRLHRLQCFVDVHGAPPAQQVEGFR